MKNTEQQKGEWSQVEEERSHERIESLNRFVSVEELISYFGRGKNLDDRVTSALQGYDIWQIFGMLGVDLPPVEAKKLKETFDPRISKLVDDLQAASSIWEEKLNGMIIKEHRPITIDSTDCGFAVNAPAHNYATDYLIRVNLPDTEIEVGDLAGSQKIVLFEPTYVSTPPIFITELSYGRRKTEKDPYVIEAWGVFLQKEDFDVINNWRSKDLSASELASEIRSKIETDQKTGLKTIFGLRLPALVDYLYAEKQFSTEEERNDFFKELENNLDFE